MFVIRHTHYQQRNFSSMLTDCNELIAMLVSTVKTAKKQ